MFRLIRYVEETSAVIATLSYGEIDVEPQTKYRYDKRNPVDPSERWQLGKYYQKDFACRVVLRSDGYDDLIEFLAGAGSFYVEYEHDENTIQYPVEIESIPKCPDNLHEYPDKIEFKLVSVYNSEPEALDWEELEILLSYLTID